MTPRPIPASPSRPSLAELASKWPGTWIKARGELLRGQRQALRKPLSLVRGVGEHVPANSFAIKKTQPAEYVGWLWGWVLWGDRA